LFEFLGGELVLVGSGFGDAEEGEEDEGEFLEDGIK